MAHLVFQTAFPGDLFLSIPLIKRLRIWDPSARIVLACRPGLGEFFLRHGLVDEIIEIDKKSGRGRAAALARLRAVEWEVILVPHQSVRTALWMWRLKATRAKVSFHSWWNGLFYNKRVVRPLEYPDALRQLSLMAPLDSGLAELFAGEDVAALKSPGTRLPVDFRATPIPEWASMQVLVAGAGTRKVFLAPGSVWATKRWTVRGYVELARELLKRGFVVELVGSRDEKVLCDEIAAAVPGVVNRAGQTSLADLVDLLATGAALVCNDSGAMHAAAAAGLPTVAVFGPTTLDLGFRPWNTRSLVVQRELPCRPCGAHGPRVCPIGTHECMEALPARDVLKALEELV